MSTKRKLQVRICKNCGKVFSTKTSRQTCSRECAAAIKKPSNTKDTICWQCKKSTTDGCSWSSKFIPVEGWKATQTSLVVRSTKGYEKEDTSYLVRSCPLFERG